MYSCFTLVTILGNELVIFPGIAFYYGNNYMYIVCVIDIHVHKYITYMYALVYINNCKARNILD